MDRLGLELENGLVSSKAGQWYVLDLELSRVLPESGLPGAKMSHQEVYPPDLFWKILATSPQLYEHPVFQNRGYQENRC